MSQDVVILGAGLSGLGCALELPGARIFEAEDRPGGMVRSSRIDSWCFDRGAHILHSKDEAWVETLCRHAGPVHQILRSRVANFWHGHWVQYPVQNHLHELPVEIRIKALSDFVKAQAAHAGQTPGNYDEWCRFQYGDFLCERFYAEYTAKYWRVPMAELATDWLAGRLLPSQIDRIVQGAFLEQAESQPAFAQFRYPQSGGIEAFFAPLFKETQITCNAAAVRLDTVRRRVTLVDGRQEEYRYLASSIPLPDLVEITEHAPESVRAAARALRSLRLFCVNMLIRKLALTPLHWLYVYDHDVAPARISLAANLAGRDSSEVTALQAEVFRLPEEAVDEPSMLSQVIRGLSRLLGFAPSDVLQAKTEVVSRSYVISDHRRAAAVQEILQWYREREVFPMGLYGAWKYVWSDQAFQSGRDTARRIQDAK